MQKFKTLFIICFSLFAVWCSAQEKATVYGIVSDNNKKPLDLVNVSIEGLPGGTTTNKNGYFELSIPSKQPINLIISFVGYDKRVYPLMLQPNERRNINPVLSTSSIRLPDFVVTESSISRTSNLTRVDPKTATIVPSLGGGIESLIKTLPGVASNNELSSQYSVRGGNFDENLVYVNDIEIYRPFLIRSGQQEGLSFLNPDLVSSISFSAGGFDAKYGDKMASVLDIQYKKPVRTSGSVQGSLLGGNMHIEGASHNYRLTYLLGVRQKSNQYLLNSLETKGDYKPSFTDVQGLITYDLNEELEISFLGYYARNQYKLKPKDRETNFGTQDEAFRFKVYFEGQEMDHFNTSTGALTLTYKPNNNLKLKFIASSFHSLESETYDILSQYWIGKLETDQSKGSNNQVVESLGVGSFLNHARNYLTADVINAEHRGIFTLSDNSWQWGLKYQHEYISDELSEWQMIDSAGYSLPVPSDSLGAVFPANHDLVLKSALRSEHTLSSNRIIGFLQHSRSLDTDNHFTLSAGIRGQYWDMNQQFLVSPRMNISFKPDWKNDVLFRFAAGLYYQPPFYREMRDLEGNLNTDLKAQSSLHFVAGSDWNFQVWSRPFKFVTEIYYKYLDNLVPYEVDNVRIRYYASNSAHGYATGIDMKINGEFVPGIESWASLSVMQTEEDIKDDFYYDYFNSKGEKIISGYTMNNVAVDSVIHHPGYIPRPTDQRFNFGLFFQDYLPNNPTYKMHLSFLYGSRLPFGPPDSPKYKHTLRIPPYFRVDIGFSKLIKGRDTKLPPKNVLNYFKNIWITAEIFNLLQVSNTVSYFWVTDVTNRQYAVPNYLTSRQLNVKLIAEF
ncbi:MAG: TonB-dependent receptor [Lentimicrobiaceae bacterium]|nr:TonB-dependent receptor [Lentimicrobiaceae bacterium]